MVIKFFTPEQIADLMQVDLETVMLWLRQKRLAGVKVGNIWRITEDQFLDFIQTHASYDTDETDTDDGVMDDDRFAEYEDQYDNAFRGSSRKRTKSGKYDALKFHLTQVNSAPTNLSFNELEKIISGKLPASAHEHVAWWGNDFSHSQARAWMHAGWEVKKVDLANKVITFGKR